MDKSLDQMAAGSSFDLSLMDWNELAGHISGIALLLARCTPGTQFDDVAAAYLGKILADLLKRPKPMAGTESSSTDAVVAYVDESFASKGMTAPSGKWLAVLIQILKVLGPILI